MLETYEKIKHLAVKDGFLRAAAGGYHFYNTSPFTFERLKTDPENIKANFESFINGFSDNVIVMTRKPEHTLPAATSFI